MRTNRHSTIVFSTHTLTAVGTYPDKCWPLFGCSPPCASNGRPRDSCCSFQVSRHSIWHWASPYSHCSRRVWTRSRMSRILSVSAQRMSMLVRWNHHHPHRSLVVSDWWDDLCHRPEIWVSVHSISVFLPCPVVSAWTFCHSLSPSLVAHSRTLFKPALVSRYWLTLWVFKYCCSCFCKLWPRF